MKFMKKIVVAILVLLIAGLASLFILGRMSGGGIPPGLTDGRLSQCPDKPNCVCSEPGTDDSHFSDPIAIPAFWSGPVLPELERIIREMGGEIQTSENNYLAATFTSAVFGFTDDFEIRIDPEKKQIHFRSASRVGYSDLGANQKRVASFKKPLGFE